MGESPCPRTRNGKPHSNVNTVIENCETKCDHMPSRVPGFPQTSRSARASAASLISTTSARRYGESLTIRTTTTISTTPTDDASAKARVQPSSESARVSGAAARIAPTWPTCPVSWVTSGAWRTRNQADTSRITLTKIIASPAPTTARAPTATGNEVANANTSWAAVINTSPVSSSARDPNRSSSTPVGICMPAYTTSWRTVKNASAVASISNRSAAIRPATPRDERLKTARM